MIIFSHIPKTAGTSFKSILRSYYGIKHIDGLKTHRYPYTADDLNFAYKIFRNPRAITGHNLVNAVENLPVSGAKYITMLREPITRCASHYQDLRLKVWKKNSYPSFEEWIEIPENQNLSVNTIAGKPDLEKAKSLLKNNYLFVGFTEYFETSIKLLKILSGENFALLNRHLIKASNNDIKSELLSNPNKLELLKKYNELDRALYDYALNNIFEPMVEKYRIEIDTRDLDSEIPEKSLDRKRKNSVRFNKFIYRQALKLFN